MKRICPKTSYNPELYLCTFIWPDGHPFTCAHQAVCGLVLSTSGIVGMVPGVRRRKKCCPDPDNMPASVATAEDSVFLPSHLTFLFSFQEAIQHKSFFEPERKLEYGNIDEAFKMVDQILEGKTLGKKWQGRGRQPCRLWGLSG